MLTDTLTSVKNNTLEQIDCMARDALLQELTCYPKPGLVSFVDSGSHDDMDSTTFVRSIASLEGYFQEIAASGAAGARFAELKRIGMLAEKRMFDATGGVNTHRGAIFTLGLMAAGTAWEIQEGRRPTPESVCQCVATLWGRQILDSPPDTASHGTTVRRRYGATGPKEEAAAGFPTIIQHALPALRRARMEGYDEDRVRLHTFFAAMAVLQDNNLLFRGGLRGLHDARMAAHEFLRCGADPHADDYRNIAMCIHRAFIARRLSPGGSADILAATLFLDTMEHQNWD